MSRLILCCFIVLFFEIPSYGQEFETSGNCSPLLVENSGPITITCRINDVPLVSVVRQADVAKLLQALTNGVAAQTILSSFAVGEIDAFAGTEFFGKVSIEALSEFVAAMSQRINLNNRINFSASKYTSLMWLAVASGRPKILQKLAELGVAVHAPRDLSGDSSESELLSEFFPIVGFIKEGGLTIGDRAALRALFDNSFLMPIVKDLRTSTDAFENAAKLNRKLAKIANISNTRSPIDMSNVNRICKLAGKSDGFDWCKRIGSTYMNYSTSDAEGWGESWPIKIELAGLMTIRNNFAVFFVHHRHKYPYRIGMLYVPKRGTKYRFYQFHSRYGTGIPCWSERLNGYKEDCWRFHRIEQDVFDMEKFAAISGKLIYTAKKKTVLDAMK